MHNYAYHKQFKSFNYIAFNYAYHHQCNPNALHNYAYRKQCNPNALYN